MANKFRVTSHTAQSTKIKYSCSSSVTKRLDDLSVSVNRPEILDITNTMEVCSDFRGLLIADHANALKQLCSSEAIEKMRDSTKKFKTQTN